MSEGSYKFKRKNIISCVGIPFRTLIWNYFCWLLAGKPEMKKQEIMKKQKSILIVKVILKKI